MLLNPLNLIALLSLPFAPIEQSTAVEAIERLSNEPCVERQFDDTFTLPTYVWAYNRCGLGSAVRMARQNGFVPTSGAIFRHYVPEAGGPAWIVYIRPCYSNDLAR